MYLPQVYHPIATDGIDLMAVEEGKLHHATIGVDDSGVRQDGAEEVHDGGDVDEENHPSKLGELL